VSLWSSGAAEGGNGARPSNIDDKLNAPGGSGDAKLELSLPRKLLLKHPGWGSDGTKTFEKIGGGNTHTHTHTHCSCF